MSVSLVCICSNWQVNTHMNGSVFLSPQDLCENHFILLIQLLSSQTTFPSGGRARATICQSMVHLLVHIGERLGREKASQLMATLQCFFACFSGVHGNGNRSRVSDVEPEQPRVRPKWDQPNGQEEEKLEDGDLDELKTPTDSSVLEHQLAGSGKAVPVSKEVNLHPLSPSPDSQDAEVGGERGEGEKGRDTATTPPKEDTTTLFENSEAFRQVCTTFSPAMAHAAYVPFCRLLGQYTLNNQLYNTDLIEGITYSHDQKAQPSPLPSIFDASEDNSPSSSDSESEENTDDDIDDSFALKLGPIAAISAKRGLGDDSASFGQSSWFVDLTEEGDREGVKNEEVCVCVCVCVCACVCVRVCVHACVCVIYGRFSCSF